MAFTSAFFDAELVNGEYDREYSAEVFAEYFAAFIANGVFPDPATNLQVVANTVNDMNVLVSTGMGWINGYYCKNDGSYPLAIQAANGTLNRIDAVVIGWSQSDRTITAYVKTGVAASAPTAPSLERSADRYELMLATITVNAGVTKITQSMITDKRPDSSVCGWVAGVVQQIDATNLFAQYDDAFQTWFEDIQAQLSGDVATNLQNQINQLNSTLSPISEDYPTLKERVRINTYNISILSLLQAKAGNFPSGTKNLIVNPITGSVNTKDYMGMVFDVNNFTSSLSEVPQKTTLSSGLITKNGIFFKGKFVYVDNTTPYPLKVADDPWGTNSKTLYTFIDSVQDRATYRITFAVEGETLYIGTIEYTSSSSQGYFTAKIFSYDGNSISLVTSKTGLSNSNEGVNYKGIVFHEDAAFFCYYPGKSGNYGGGILLLDGTYTTKSLCHLASLPVESELGFYFAAGAFSPNSSNTGIASFNDHIVSLVAANNVSMVDSICFKGRAFFLSNSNCYVETARNTFTTHSVGGRKFAIIGNTLYIIGESARACYRYDEGTSTFVSDSTIWNKLAIPSNQLYSIYGVANGLNTEVALLYTGYLTEFTYTTPTNGFYQTTPYQLDPFNSIDLYVGISLTPSSVQVSVDGGSSWISPNSIQRTGDESYAHFDITGSSLAIKVTFPLSSGDFNYLMGGVY